MARAFEVRERGLHRGQPGEPCVMVIFGAAGDLARNDLVPSLYELHRKGLLPERFAAVGFSRTRWDSAQYRNEMCAAVRESCGSGGGWDDFARRLSFVAGDATSPDGYAALARGIAEARSAFGVPDNVFFHLAVPPALFPEIVRGLAASGLARCGDAGWRRLVVEKPFGHDRASARELDHQLREAFREEEIYRIDHFLGKETVQNMLVFRFANPSFEPVWNRNYIDHVQITVAEDIGIGTRANFYEQTGIVRDMVQNHLLHLLCLTAIEPPVRFDAVSLRNETAKVLDAIVASKVDGGARTVLGQYGPGTMAGKQVAGYREEPGVDAGSTTPTYAALRLAIDNWRWADVPFYLRTGKRLPRKLTEVAIEFKPTPHAMFGAQHGRRHRKVLVFQLQPDEGIVQDIAAKQPGPDLTIQPVRMTFSYADAFGVEQPPRAYAWLLLDVMQGDQTLFARQDWIDKAWGIVDPIVAHRIAHPPAFPNYAAGTPGPSEADALLAKEARRWRAI